MLGKGVKLKRSIFRILLHLLRLQKAQQNNRTRSDYETLQRHVVCEPSMQHHI